jgi:hypothetical protein
VSRIKETVVNNEPWHVTWYPPGQHQHSTGQSTATIAGTITNHNQNIIAGDASSSDTNTTIRLDGMASSFILHREKNLY